MITAAKKIPVIVGKRDLLDQRGQSILEFLFMLPLMLGLTVLMLRVNTAMQASIVDQQYARAQATWLTFNSPIYPRLSLQSSELNEKNYNQMMIGVSSNLISNDGEGNDVPAAQTAMIARSPAAGAAGSNEPQTEPQQRAIVRIRNTVTLCTQANVVGGQPVLPISAGNGTAVATGAYNLKDGTKFDYCQGYGQ